MGDVWYPEVISSQPQVATSWYPSNFADSLKDAYLCVKNGALDGVASRVRGAPESSDFSDAKLLSNPVYVSSCCHKDPQGLVCGVMMLGDDPKGSCAPLDGYVEWTRPAGQCYQLNSTTLQSVNLKAQPPPEVELKLQGAIPSLRVTVFAKYEYDFPGAPLRQEKKIE